MLSEDLLTLQRLDTTIDQDVYRRAHLPERDAAAQAEQALRTSDARRVVVDARDTELDAAIAALEQDGERMHQQRTRLDGQLRTVTSTRQAEAIEHELAALAAKRDELDDRELAHLEEQSNLANERSELEARRPSLASAADAAAAALGAAEGSIDAALTQQRADRAEVVARIDAAWLQQYERLRTRYGGVAVGELHGARCSGCHLDLSSAEVESVKATPPGEVADCPQCGRLLVR